MLLKLWLEGMRPKTLVASAAPVFIGGVMAYKTVAFFHPFIFFLTLLCALFIQIGTNYANDYFDYQKGADTEQRKGPRRLTQQGLIPPKTMLKAANIVFILASFSALFLIKIGGWPIAFLAILSIALGYLYTAGPFPLGYIGIADFFVLFFFGPIATATTFYLQTKQFSPMAVIAGFSPGLISTAILTSNNLRDREEDLKAGKKTLPVRLGLTFGCFEYAFCLCLGTLLPFFLMILTNKAPFFCFFPSLTFLLACPLIKKAFKKQNFSLLLPKTGKLMLVFTLLFVLGWLL